MSTSQIHVNHSMQLIKTE